MCKPKKIAGLLFALAMVFGLMLGMSVTVMADNQYLTFTGTEDFSIGTANQTKNWTGPVPGESRLEYSTDPTDETSWCVWDGTTTLQSVNKVLCLRGTGNRVITGAFTGTSLPNIRWVISPNSYEGKVSCDGDIRTLLKYDDVHKVK